MPCLDQNPFKANGNLIKPDLFKFLKKVYIKINNIWYIAMGCDKKEFQRKLNLNSLEVINIFGFAEDIENYYYLPFTKTQASHEQLKEIEELKKSA